MLKELNLEEKTDLMDQEGSPKNEPSSIDRVLTIHHTNLYKPHRIGVTSIAFNSSKSLFAARRGYNKPTDINHPFSLVDLYEIPSSSILTYCATITVYEDITGLVWINDNHLLTVSRQSTINIYQARSCANLKTLTTDYGPILSMKYSPRLRLLITGTELGFIAAYRVSWDPYDIKFVEKLVKINVAITALDFHSSEREKTTAKRKKTFSRIPSKRKRGKDTSEESDMSESDDGQDEDPQVDLFEKYDLTIYGANTENVCVWDFHRNTIIDKIVVSNQITALRTLGNGDVILGDCKGHLGIFDKNSLTCRQSDHIFEGPVLALSRNKRSTKILATGEKSNIVMLKADKNAPTRDEYILFENFTDHIGAIKCAEFCSSRDFYTASQDSKIIKFEVTQRDGRKVLNRHVTRPYFFDRVHANAKELLLIYGKSLMIYKLSEVESPDLSAENLKLPICVELPPPRKGCTVRIGRYVHSATFSNKWVCYSTNRGLYIHDRLNIKQRYTTTYSLPKCHALELTECGRYLVAAQQEKLFVIRLESDPSESTNRPDEAEENGDLAETGSSDNDSASEDIDQDESDSKKDAHKARQSSSHEHEVVFALKLKGVIKKIFHMTHLNRIVAVCGISYSHHLYQFQLPDLPNCQDKSVDDKIFLQSRINFPHHLINVTFNPFDENDHDLYIYTGKCQLVKYNCLGSAGQKGEKVSPSTLNGSTRKERRKSRRKVERQYVEDLMSKESINGLSRGTKINGMIVISSDYCILYGDNKMFKLDIARNEIINENQDYANISLMSNYSMFKKSNELLIISSSV